MSIAEILYKSFFWKVGQFIISFVLNIFFVRFLQAEKIGEFHSLIYLYSFFVSFFTLGLDLGITYFVSRKIISPNRARSLIVAVVAFSLITGLPFLYYFYDFSIYTNVSLHYALGYAALFISGSLLTKLSTAFFAADGKNHFPVRILFIYNCLVLFVSIILSLTMAREALIHTILPVYFIGSFLGGITIFILTFFLYNDAETSRISGMKGIKKIFIYSLKTFVISFLFFCAMKINLLLLSFMVSPFKLGNYTQSFKVIEYIITFVAFSSYPLISIYMNTREKPKADMTLFLVRISNTLILILIAMLALTGYWLFPYLFGASFSGMYSVFMCFIPGIFASCASIFFTSYFFGYKMLYYNLVSALLFLFTSLLFFFLLTPAYDIEGAAIAFSLSAVISYGYDIVIFRNKHVFRLSQLFFATREDIARLANIPLLKSIFYNQ